ncbi:MULTISPECIES: fimbrillin family protein [Elizabethkingia]|uniref:fimbrillin family protein n=1 Tax=Elizabethkingia TaxID=308865 RepID=UPI0020138BF3|nr:MULTISPECIES: fimbrillin family protein [Elizabethkingia]MCL1643186.1 fimbrillin family protein [Elizabethkingia anophelis]MCL1643867.1 fimbrillin family protein [Elizabethkingia anophelis]MDX8556753.1 fimbrillin family protein [Elizabethkingia sp. HX CGY]UXM68281.1 fimbrillin family protein [Elizabethkingia anophelis]WBS71850.1 fimbrillin family protein [Elizabethkingia anophelis]
MKSIIKHTITRIILVIFSLVIISCRQSDDHITDPGTETGPASVKINLQGSDYNDGGTSKIAGVNGINSVTIQTEEISFNNTNDYKLVATLTPEESSNPRVKTGITGISPLPDGTRYRIAVFDSNGNYITEQIYFTGSESSMPAITGLNGGSTYTFVVYSIGTQIGLPAITFADPGNKTLATATVNNVSGDNDLMYFSKTMTLTGGNANYLDVILQHKYSQITTTIDSTPTNYYTIQSITNATITPHSSSATLNLANGSVTRATSSSRTITFSGSGTTVTAPAVFINTATTATGILSIGSAVLRKASGFLVTHENIEFKSLKINPGVKYNLKLSFVPNDRYITSFKGYPAVRINGVIFMRHNLGANISLNPDAPSVNIAGNYYQRGKKNPVATSSTPTGPISGWDSTVAPDNVWNSGTALVPVKTATDPCPTGWRVMSNEERWILVENTTYSYTGNASTSNIGSAAAVFTSKFNTNVKITLPFTGYRDGGDGHFTRTATGDGSSPLIDGSYWHADGRGFSLFNTTGVSSWNALNTVAARGFPIRCVAEYPY